MGDIAGPEPLQRERGRPQQEFDQGVLLPAVQPGREGRARRGGADDEIPGFAEGAGRWSKRKSTRLNSSHDQISYAVFCLKKKKNSRRKQVGAEGIRGGECIVEGGG